MEIAICMVINNDEETIQNCINSIKDIPYKNIYYTDLNSYNGANKFTKDFVKINPVSKCIKDNKNNLIKNVKEDWILFIEPWEIFYSGKEEIQKIIENENAYRILLLENQTINKSIRIFKKTNFEFENEIYEEIYEKNTKILNIVFKKNKINIHDEYKKIKSWINKNKLNPRPYYYLSCYYLKNKDYINFKKTSEKYLFLEKKILPSTIMTKYYLSLVELHIFNNPENSVKNIIQCLDEKPDMAEFWCVLGDLNFKLNKYQKAIYFYENAIIFGENRKIEDEFSIEIKKYKIYPEEMINESINKLNLIHLK